MDEKISKKCNHENMIISSDEMKCPDCGFDGIKFFKDQMQAMKKITTARITKRKPKNNRKSNY